jgi:hypothetical protein
MIGAEDIMALGQAMAQGLARAGTHRDAYLRAVVPFQLRRLARPHDRISALTAQLAPSVHDVLMGRRSVLAAAAASPDRDWVLIWGAEHAEPVRAGLEAAGWIPAGKRRWVTVGQLPPLALCWARLAAVAGKVGLDTFRASMAELEARGAVSPSGTGPG